MDHYETSMRDSVFWQMTKRITNIVNKFKNKLTGYKTRDVDFDGVKINNVKVDKLVTTFKYFDSDITNGITFDMDNKMCGSNQGRNFGENDSNDSSDSDSNSSESDSSSDSDSNESDDNKNFGNRNMQNGNRGNTRNGDNKLNYRDSFDNRRNMKSNSGNVNSIKEKTVQSKPIFL